MGPSFQEVSSALTRLGNYRVLRAQRVANLGTPDGISGALLLALGMRETWLRNVEGGAKLVDGAWVPEDDPARMDVGWTQISRRFHREALSRMPAVAAGTWAPVVRGVSAATEGHVPRFEEALQFTLTEIHENIALALDAHVPVGDVVKVAVAAHNAGFGDATHGALGGYRAGNVDRFTVGGNYSGWVMAAKSQVNRWLGDHPLWRI